MKTKILGIASCLFVLLLALSLCIGVSTTIAQPTQEEVKEAIAKGVAWLADQQRSGPPPCADPSRTIFAGGPGTAACHQFDGDQASCEAAWHMSGSGSPASCFYHSGSCSGCGPSNEGQGLCANTCGPPQPPSCEDASPSCFWGDYERCAVTALAVKKLEHHAVDPKWGFGLDSPFDDAYPYKKNVEKGLKWLFDNCAYTKTIGLQDSNDPDTDGDDTGVYFEDSGSGVWHRSYTTGIALMTICEAVELDREVESGPLAGWTYEDVARDTMDYLAFSQMDSQDGNSRGGWGYAGSDNGVYEAGWDRSDNSNAGWVTLGLGYAVTPKPEGCGFTIPQFVRDELEIWIDYIQNDVGVPDNLWCDNAGTGDCDGGSGYADPSSWVNILKTGNLLQQMAFVGDTTETQRVKDALDYMARHWNDANVDPGWRGRPMDNDGDQNEDGTIARNWQCWDGVDNDGDGNIDGADTECQVGPAVDEDPMDRLDNDGDGWIDEDPVDASNYHATFTAMKGFTSFGLYEEFGDPPIKWQEDFETELVAEQIPDPNDPNKGYWSGCLFGDDILCTTWALLTLQKVAPPPAVPVDIKPQSCPNPLNVKDKGVLPVAILGTENFDVTQVDPASVRLEEVAPLRSALEDVATPFEPFTGKENCFEDCTTEGSDGFMDLTLKFSAQEVISALGDVSDGDCLVLHLTGNLKEEYGGSPFVGEDVVLILKKGK